VPGESEDQGTPKRGAAGHVKKTCVLDIGERKKKRLRCSQERKKKKERRKDLESEEKETPSSNVPGKGSQGRGRQHILSTEEGTGGGAPILREEMAENALSFAEGNGLLLIG